MKQLLGLDLSKHFRRRRHGSNNASHDIYTRCSRGALYDFELLGVARSMSEDNNSEEVGEHEYLMGLRQAGALTPEPDGGESDAFETASQDIDEEGFEMALTDLEQIAGLETKLFGIVDKQEKWHDSGASLSPKKNASSKLQTMDEVSIETVPIIRSPHAYPCENTFKALPSPPSRWPQAPIMMRPTPGSHTKIRGLRYAETSNGTGGQYQSFSGFCAGCILPMNNGKEGKGKSVVIDFETPLFIGSIMVRVRDAPPVSVSSSTADDSLPSYFDNRKRIFQVLVKGKFQKPFKMSELVTGQSFDRPAGSLPARWIVSAFIRFISTLSPQLEANFGEQPRFLTPLMATAHTVLVKDYPSSNVENGHSETPETTKDPQRKEREMKFQIYPGALDMEQDIVEPQFDEPTSILRYVPSAKVPRKGAKSVGTRQSFRKKLFNSISAKHANEPCCEVDKEYSFEFYQHLLLLTEPDEFKIDVVHSKIGMSSALDGQPIKIFAAHKDPVTEQLTSLWSFELWHQALYERAKEVLDDT